MTEKRPVTPISRIKTTEAAPIGREITPAAGFFTRDNYIWMLAGVIVIIIGMFIMSGGKSSSPGVFDQKEVYSTTRITIAPLLIVIGLGLEVFAIFRKIKI